MSNGSRTPNNVEVLAAKDSITGLAAYVTSTGRKLDVNATASLAGVAIPIVGATTAVGVAIVDGSGNQITSFGGGTQYIDGGVVPAHATAPSLVWSDGSNWQTVSTAKPLPVTATISGTPAVTVTGSVTANAGSNLNTSLLALEAGGNLAAIKAKTDNIPAQGQALSAASMPVVLPATQITSLTPPAAITNYALETGGNLATIAGYEATTAANTTVMVNNFPTKYLPQVENVVSVGSQDVATSAPGVQLVSLAGELGDALTTTGNALNVNLVNSSLAVGTPGGITPYFFASVTNTILAVKSSAGVLYGYHFFNGSSTVTYVQFFNGAATLGTTSPVFSLAVPAGGWADANASFPGIAFSKGIYFAATLGVTNSTAPTAALATANIWYS